MASPLGNNYRQETLYLGGAKESGSGSGLVSTNSVCPAWPEAGVVARSPNRATSAEMSAGLAPVLGLTPIGPKVV